MPNHTQVARRVSQRNCRKATDNALGNLHCTQYLVSLHPEVEARLVAELTELGLAGPAARPVEFQDLGRLRYLGAVVKVCCCCGCCGCSAVPCLIV